MNAPIDQQAIAMIAAKVKRAPESIAPATTFAELGIDSLAAIELIFQFEDTFNITISDETVRGLRTVQDVVDALRTAVAGAPSAS
jgi:acyl carrier protein